VKGKKLLKKRPKKKIQREYREYEELIDRLCRKMTNINDLIENGVSKCGGTNKWEGISGFKHQIDVSLKNNQHVLLIECKYWKNRIRAEVILSVLKRLEDIRNGPEANGRECRIALVVSKGFQKGVKKLGEFYKKEISFFRVDKDEMIEIISHTHFLIVVPLSIKMQVQPTIITQGQ